MILDITAELKQNLSLAFILFYRLQAKVTGLHFAPATPQLASVARIRIISSSCFLFFFMYTQNLWLKVTGDLKQNLFLAFI